MNTPHEPLNGSDGLRDRGGRATARDRAERAVQHRFVAKLEGSTALRYMLAPVCIAVAVSLHLSVLGPFLHPTGLFLAGIVAAAWFGGAGPGFLSALLATFVLPQLIEMNYPLVGGFFDLPRFLAFGMTGLAVGWGTTSRKRAEEALRRSELELREAGNELEIKVTERTAALRISEERYARAMDGSDAGHWDWNFENDEMFVSARAQAMLGLGAGPLPATRAEIMSLVAMPPEDRQSMDKAVAVSIGSGSHERDYRVVTASGDVRWLHSRAKVFRGDSGEPVRMTGSLTDITDRKLAADALRESEARSRSLTELSSDWYWKQDENLRFTYLSSEVHGLAGSTAESSIGKTRWELSNMTPLSCSWSEHRAVLDARQPFRDLEYCRLGQDGRPRYISVSGVPIFDEHGSFKGYQGIGRDISERKRIEEELRARQEMLDLAQKAARAVAFEWRIGAGEGENRSSPDLEAMYGLAPRSYDGTFETWSKLVFPEDWPAVQAAIKHAHESGDLDAEYRVVHPDGAVRWLQAKGRMLFDVEGKPARMVGFMLDVTDRHQAQEELGRMERQLRQAQRLEAMGTLAGGIAHDFNNILGAILGYGEMALRDAPTGSRLRRDVDSIMTAGERGRALVDRVLAFSRSGVGERVAVHVEEVVREALELIAAKLPNGVTIETQLHAGHAAMLGDPTQVHQVLMNLATNAIQAMSAGGRLRVSLNAVRVDVPRVATIGAIKSGDYIVLEIADCGTGIPKEIIDRIFDPFFTTKEVGVGTGLGLSLVHGIVSQVDGAIEVVSTLGMGTVFTVYLPRVGDAADVLTDERPDLPHGDRQRILIVDDEEPLVRLATENLAEWGYVPIGFTSSTAAFEAFRADPQYYDAVVTDERMPGMSGSALIRELRGMRQTIPTLLVSGYVGTELVSRAKEAGADEVLKKPLSMRELATSLDRVLHTTRARLPKDRGASPSADQVAKGRRRTAASPSRPRPARRR
jgi:PAS domain S-box-containing protein